MTSIRRFISILVVLCLFFSNICLSVFAESVLELPMTTISIGKEAFYGTQSLETVVLPEGLMEISDRAFANSSVKLLICRQQ